MSETIERLRRTFDVAEAALPGAANDRVRQLRRGALDDFAARGFPRPREEDWKYTRVTAIEKREFALGGADASVDPAPYLLPADSGAHQLVFVDGRLRSDLSTAEESGAGIRIQGLADALGAGDAAIEGVLNRFLDTGAAHANGFSALNTAFAADGVVLSLARDAVLASPLHLLFLASGNADTMANPRIIIDCAEGARATVVEHYAACADAAYFNNVVTQVNLARGASLEHYKLQREAGSAFHIARMDVQQDADSALLSHSVNLGAALARHDINVALAAPGASCTLNGLYASHARQHVDYHTRVDHIAPGCTSDEDYRGILGGRSRGVFNGRVYVHPDAQKSDASQSNRNLLLSRDAEIDTKPQLEIHANDVKCAHGATVGQLDARMIFYLRSRGIEESAARALLTYGFARDLIDRMDLAAVREIVADALLDRLPHAGELRSMLS